VKSISVAEAKSDLHAVLARVEAGEEIAVTRSGKVVARLVPAPPRMAAEAFRDFWSEDVGDLMAPTDPPPKDVAALDD
jgi:prevent-host-death family protein